MIVIDHSGYDYSQIVRLTQLVVDTRNATRGISASHIVQRLIALKDNYDLASITCFRYHSTVLPSPSSNFTLG